MIIDDDTDTNHEVFGNLNPSSARTGLVEMNDLCQHKADVTSMGLVALRDTKGDVKPIELILWLCNWFTIIRP